MNDLLTKSNLSVRFSLALTAMATIVLELILTRVFSATAGYHFAFMIVSMAMFGMTAGALFAFVRPPVDGSKLYAKLSLHASLLATCIPLSYMANLAITEVMKQIGVFAWLALTFILYSVPFFFSGVAVSLCLTRFKEVGKLYSADLFGAAVSCPLLIAALLYLDPQRIVAFGGLVAVGAAICFASNAVTEPKPKMLFPPLLAMVVCLVVACLPERTSAQMEALFGKISYIKWSPIGRVVVGDTFSPADTWAAVKDRDKAPSVAQHGLWIDFGASTVMTDGSATKAQLEPIGHDVTAVGNRLRPNRSLFVIGVGGGRDILTGLLFGQKRIDGVEVNPAIVYMLKQKYADFDGHIAEKPGVSIMNDEARNWLARSHNQYGLIQCSLVDTWSASSSGAFMLTENALYTRQAFELYLRKLEKDGILCMLRWGDDKSPDQVLRMVFLAKSALQSSGVQEVGDHIMVLSAKSSPLHGGHAIGAMLVSPRKFSSRDVEQLVQIAHDEDYKLLWVPGVAKVEPFASAITQPITDPGMPTDDRPFFFTPVKQTDNAGATAEPGGEQGLALLSVTLIFATALVLAVIVFPAALTAKGKTGSVVQTLRSGVFFGGLGLAFMFVEVAQLQRLTLLLGNPTYGLSAVLFALLLASGLGSFVAQVQVDRGKAAKTLARLGLGLAALSIVVCAVAFSFWLPALEATQLHERMIAAILLVSVPGFFMGWGFPMGMIIFTVNLPESGSWYWALNGATSVLGSVLAAIISVIFGVEATLMAGAVCYLCALAAA